MLIGLFLNDEPFTDEFKRRVRGMTRGDVNFGLIPKEHWSYPDWINRTKAAEERRKMAEDHVICACGAAKTLLTICRRRLGELSPQSVELR